MTISEQLPVARKKIFFLCEKNHFRKSYARSTISKRPFYANTRKRRQKWSEKTYFVFKLQAFNKKLTNIFFKYIKIKVILRSIKCCVIQLTF